MFKWIIWINTTRWEFISREFVYLRGDMAPFDSSSSSLCVVRWVNKHGATYTRLQNSVNLNIYVKLWIQQDWHNIGDAHHNKS